MDLLLIGINYDTAPVEMREHIALPGELTTEILHVIRTEEVAEEALVLDTCNRTEFYLVRPAHDDPLPHLLKHIANIKDRPEDITASYSFFRRSGLDAVRHLFRVAASLESQMVGEHEILGQVKDAYREALETRTADFFLNKMLHRSFRAGKRVRSETDLCEGPASVAGAAVQMADTITEDLEDRTVLLVGAGETAETAAQSLLKAGAGRIIVANRTLSRAHELCHALAVPGEYDANEPGPSPHARAHARPDCPLDHPDACPAEAIELGDLAQNFPRADVVICSTGASEPVLDASLTSELNSLQKCLCIIDIAVPRDVAPELGELENVHLRNIDDLEGIVEENSSQRQSEIPLAEAIVDEEVDKFQNWLDALQVVPTIKQLKKHFAETRREVLDQQPGDLSDEERDRLRAFGERLCGKILHDPFTHLQRSARNDTRGEVLKTVEVVHRIFDLDDVE